MHGSTRSSIPESRTRWWLVALCVCGAALSSAAYADEGRHRGNSGKLQHSEWSHGRHSDRRHDGWERARRDDHRGWQRRGGHERVDRGRLHSFDGRRHLPRSHWSRSDWHYYGGRYWAPASYRGRWCNDFHHHRGVHYHVAARDYYEYYYPRYRYYGPRPLGANASVIISIPLF